MHGTQLRVLASVLARVPHPRFLRVGLRVAVAQPILEHLAENVLQNAAVVVVGNLFRSVDARDHGELFALPVVGFGAYVDGLSWRERSDALDVKHFMAGETQ